MITPHLEWTIYGLAAGSALILTFYYLIFFNRLNFRKTSPKGTLVPVSVIIAARNARKQLEANLPSILTQDYPDFEVVVVNDGSYDGTKDLLTEMQKDHPNLRVVQLDIEEQYRKGKKFALTMGIKRATHSQLLFTDADCKASSPHWIRHMMEAKGDKPIVLGYAPLHTKPTPLGAMNYYETFHTGLQYLSYALAGRTYMGVGRNLSYTKELFFANKGFASHQHILSGDDDLFIQEVAEKDNVAICTDPESFMYSQAKSGLGAYVKQKKRHLSTAREYEARFKFLLGLYSLAHLLFYLAVICGIIFDETRMVTLYILGVKWILQWPVFFMPARRLNATYVAFALPFYDLYYTAYLFLFSLVKPFSRSRQWN